MTLIAGRGMTEGQRGRLAESPNLTGGTELVAELGAFTVTPVRR